MFAALTRLLTALRNYVTISLTSSDGRLASSREGEATCKLDIIVVGCSLSGLAAAYCLGKAGHRVTVVEAAEVLGDIGAGLQLGPNLSRLLLRWGLREKLDTLAVRPEAISFMRYDTGERVGIDIYGPKVEMEYGVPHYQAHRADLHQMLCDIALPLVNIRLKSRVVSPSPDPPSPCVTLQSDEVIYDQIATRART